MIRVYKQPVGAAISDKGYIWCAHFGRVHARGATRTEALDRLEERVQGQMALLASVPPPELLFRVVVGEMDSITGLLYRTGAEWTYAIYYNDASAPEVISERFDFQAQARDTAKLDAAWRYRHRLPMRGCEVFGVTDVRLKFKHEKLLAATADQDGVHK